MKNFFDFTDYDSFIKVFEISKHDTWWEPRDLRWFCKCISTENKEMLEHCKKYWLEPERQTNPSLESHSGEELTAFLKERYGNKINEDAVELQTVAFLYPDRKERKNFFGRDEFRKYSDYPMDELMQALNDKTTMNEQDDYVVAVIEGRVHINTNLDLVVSRIMFLDGKQVHEYKSNH